MMTLWYVFKVISVLKFGSSFDNLSYFLIIFLQKNLKETDNTENWQEKFNVKIICDLFSFSEAYSLFLSFDILCF